MLVKVLLFVLVVAAAILLLYLKFAAPDYTMSGGSESAVIEPLAERHRHALAAVAGDPAVMERVGNGPWGADKISRLFTQLRADSRIPEAKRAYYHFAIMCDKQLAGYLGLHPSPAAGRRDDPRLYVTIFVATAFRRRGLAAAAIKSAVARLRRCRGPTVAFGAHIAADNEPSLALHRGLGFQNEAVETIAGRNFLALALPPPLPAAAAGTCVVELENLYLPEIEAATGLRRVPFEKAVAVGGAELVLAHGELAFDKRMWRVVTRMRGRLDAEAITDKTRLHVALANSKVVAETAVLDRAKAPPGGWSDEHPWVWRPGHGWAGKGIAVGQGRAALAALPWQPAGLTGLLTRIETAPALLPWRARDFPDPGFPGDPSHKDRLPDPNPVAKSPAATDEVELRKFHLRIYVIIVCDAHGKRRALYNDGHLICFADAAYVPGDFSNPRAHNTRLRGYNVKPFPESYDAYAAEGARLAGTPVTTAAGIMTQLRELFAEVARVCMPSVRPYAESHHGFEILGCDVMVAAGAPGRPDSAGATAPRAWIVEMNKKHASFKLTPPQAERVARCLYGGALAYLKAPGSNEFLTEVWSS
jgi:RimJ/RimL family protein N-acetyltransferase